MATARWRRHWREWLVFAAFVAPNLILFAAFTYWPIVYSFAISLTDWNLLRPAVSFEGMGNYAALLRDRDFWRVVLNTMVYAFSVVAVAQAIAFVLALFLNAEVPGRTLFRTIAFSPYVTTPAAAALVWVVLLDPHYGPLSALYHVLGVEGPAWLASSTLALGALIIVGIWKEIGFASLFFVAGLQGIPIECYEAAAIDGASIWRRVIHITLPLMTPVIFFLSVTGFIAATKAFDIVAIMTEGGPVYPASSTYVYHLYVLAFRDYQAGLASAFAVIFFVTTIALTIAQFKAGRRWVHHGD